MKVFSYAKKHIHKIPTAKQQELVKFLKKLCSLSLTDVEDEVTEPLLFEKVHHPLLHLGLPFRDFGVVYVIFLLVVSNSVILKLPKKNKPEAMLVFSLLFHVLFDIVFKVLHIGIEAHFCEPVGKANVDSTFNLK